MAERLSALRPGCFIPPGRYLVLISVRGWVDPRVTVRLEGLGLLKKSTSSGTRTGDLPACSIVLQPTTRPRAPEIHMQVTYSLIPVTDRFLDAERRAFFCFLSTTDKTNKLHRPSDRRLSAKLVPTFADRGCRVVSATDPHGHILGFLDRSRYYFFQVAPQLYSRGWEYPVPDPLLLRKSGSAGNRSRDLWICSQELRPLDHRGGLRISTTDNTSLCPLYHSSSDLEVNTCVAAFSNTWPHSGNLYCN
jgi:hypothetical protein